MLFNSYLYLLAFLPIVAVGYFLLARHTKISVATYWLIAASLFFYSFWNPIYLPLLLGSIVYNYFVGKWLQKSEKLSNKRLLLTAGIIANVGLLGYFKYVDFFIGNINTVFGSNLSLLHIVLPLAISFFTFQQIAYLVDSYRGLVENHSFREYTLFVSFFPQLISGPIVHHSEMMPQFQDKKNLYLNYENVVAGLFLLSMGLFKKVVVADTFAVWASSGFDSGIILSLFESWIVSLAYTFQLYFDFSGYTDMALGAALIFNIKLPINFNSPYKAKNIQDFWRRWHITLSRFLKDYVYIPLGGNRRGEFLTLLNVGIVFLVGGLWHGAGWTFVVWGALHGLAVITLLAWRKLNIGIPTVLSWFLTFLFVDIAWVFFRSDSLVTALQMLQSMLGLNGVGGLSLLDSTVTPVSLTLFSLTSLNVSPLLEIIIWMGIAFFVVFFTKNSMERVERFKSTTPMLLLMLTMVLLSLFFMNSVSEFIYFNF